MNKLECLFKIILLSISVSMLGCSYNNISEVDKTADGEPERIVGIQDLYRAGANNVNILFIHGMGYHPLKKELGEKGETRVYQSELAKKLGFRSSDELVIASPTSPLKLNQVIAGYLHWRKFKDKSGRTLNLFVLSWDRGTEIIQKSMFELDEEFYERGESAKDREKERVFINRELKRFINRSFADPAIYLGSFGPEIRNVAAEGIAKMDAILLVDEDLDQKPENNQIVHISDSLGSSVIFDTVKESMKSDDKSRNLYKHRASIERFAGLSRLIYMNANQLPLIEVGRIEGPGINETETEWLGKYPCNDSPKLVGGSQGILDFGRTRKVYIETTEAIPNDQVPELQLVAFTDPNDALSYYLTARFKQHCSGEKVRIVNVMLTNARWNWLFVLADPVKAHAVGFKTNNKAIKLLIHGVDPKEK